MALNNSISVLIWLAVCGCGTEAPQIKSAPAQQPAQQPAPPTEHASDGEVPPIAPEQLPGWGGKVVGIVDGDTIDVLTEDKKTVRLRLNGIDTPERGQPFGNNATRWISDAIGGQMVRIVETDEPDRYGEPDGYRKWLGSREDTEGLAEQFEEEQREAWEKKHEGENYDAHMQEVWDECNDSCWPDMFADKYFDYPVSVVFDWDGVGAIPKMCERIPSLG